MIELIGEFRDRWHDVVYRGFRVPNLHVSEQEDGTWLVTFDGRWGFGPFSRHELNTWLPLVADAQAVGAGYACHGAETKHNPFRVAMIGIGAVNVEEPKPGLHLVDPATTHPRDAEKP